MSLPLVLAVLTRTCILFNSMYIIIVSVVTILKTVYSIVLYEEKTLFWGNPHPHTVKDKTELNQVRCVNYQWFE